MWYSAIIINVVARTAVQTTATILENDTANKVDKEKEQSDSERVNALRLRRKREALASGTWEAAEEIRIEHKSLILAQDERWRRA